MNKFPPKRKDNSHIVKIAPKNNWSQYQKDIFKDIGKGTGNTVVKALAGSGKTSTIIEGFKYLPKSKTTLMVAFNKSIADELKQRAPSYVNCSTMHSLGYKAIKQTFGNNVVLSYDKCRLIVSSFIGSEKETWDLNRSICQCISLCKGFLFDTPSNVEKIIDEFQIEIFELSKEKFIQYVLQSMALCKKQTNVIDFDDMIWFPFVYRLNIGKFDYIFVDETQDLNPAQIAMVLSARKPTTRVIAVGDPYQSIYQFRGADEYAMDNLIKKLDAKILPLPISYRCPKKVIALAQKMVSEIQHAPEAIDGVVEDLSENELLKNVKVGDFILSRTNAPLIKYCMKLLKKGVPANIQGRDIASGLVSFVNKSKAKDINKFIEYVNEWREIEVKRLLSEKRDPMACTDKAECLLNLCEGILSIEELKALIDKLFVDVDDNKKVILSTTHKAKGLERDNVYVLFDTYRYGEGVEGEEKNIYYVAITRAKKKLFLVKKESKYSKFDIK